MVLEKHISDDSKEQGPLLSAWAELLGGYVWDYFVTLTRDPGRAGRFGPENLVKAVEWFLRSWQIESAIGAGVCERIARPGWVAVADRVCGRIVRGQVWGEREKLRGPWWNAYRARIGHPVWVLGVERHRDGRLHAHLAVRLASVLLRRLDFSAGHKLWNNSYGFSWIQSARSSGAVSRYVSKYVAKGDIELSPNFSSGRDRQEVAEFLAPLSDVCPFLAVSRGSEAAGEPAAVLA